MILTVTPNPALDITYLVPQLHPGTTNIVSSVRTRAGGKGINVASVLADLGESAAAVTTYAGFTGAQLRENLSARGLRTRLVEIPGQTRRTVAIVADDGSVTLFNEPGADLRHGDWEALVGALERELAAGATKVVVASGSLPPAAPRDGYAQIVAAAHRGGARCLVDAGGDALLASLAAGPDLVKPNRREAAEATGAWDVGLAAARLHAAGAGAVAISDGPAGVFLRTTSGATHHARLREALSGNPTGAGDALAAALSLGLAQSGDDIDWEQALRFGVAVSAAAVLQDVAGHVDPGDVDRLLALTTTRC